MDRASAVFCAAALAASLAAAAAGFHLAALPREALERAATPARAETLPDVDLGGGFGTVPVLELVGYYIDNPPGETQAHPSAAAAARPKRFGGC